MRMKYRINFLTAIAILTLSILMSPASVSAEDWKIIDDDSWCSEGAGFFQKTACETRELIIHEAWKMIRVDASPNGNSTVEGWDKDSIRIQARIQTNAKKLKDAEELLSEVEIKTGNNRIRAEGPMHFSSRKWWSVSFHVMVPKLSDLDLKAMNGGISINNLEGRIDAKTLNGGIDLQGIAGDVEAHTTNGGITAELNEKRWLGRGLDVSTINGGIRLAIPEDFSAELEMSTVNGVIYIDFPIMVKGRIDKNIKTTLGEGGATIKAKTINGGVTVDKN